MKKYFHLLLLFALSTPGCAQVGIKSSDIFANDPSFRERPERSISSENFPAAPSRAVFNDIHSFASRKNFLGNDVIACLDPQTGRLKLGGTLLFSGSMHLFMDYAGGRMDMGPFQRTSADGDRILVYSGGESLKFAMTPQGRSGDMATYYANVFNGSGQTSTRVACFIESSGLE